MDHERAEPRQVIAGDEQSSAPAKEHSVISAPSGALDIEAAYRNALQARDFDSVWSICKGEGFRRRQIENAAGVRWGLQALRSAVELFAANEEVPDQAYRLAWLLTELAAAVDSTSTNIDLPLSLLERDHLDSFSEIRDAIEMLEGGGDSLFLRSACLLQKEVTLQLARLDGAPNPGGLSAILTTIGDRIPKPDRAGLSDTGIKNVGFLGPLAASLAALAPTDDIASFLTHCDSDSLNVICKHLCAAAPGLPMDHARNCLHLALALGAAMDWSFRMSDPVSDICTAAAKGGLLLDLLSETRDLPQETAESFRCKAALAAYDPGDDTIDPLALLHDVEDIRARDDATDTLACWMLNNQDLSGALKAIEHAVTIDGCEISLTRAAHECHAENNRAAVATLARKMNKGENAADVFIALAGACADADASTASSLLNEAAERARSADDPEDRVLKLSEAARQMHRIGCQDTAQVMIQDAVERLSDINVDYHQDYALGQICEACAETGHTRRLSVLFTLLNDRTQTPDILGDVASVCAETADHAAFADVLRACVEGLSLTDDDSPEEDIADALKEFSGKLGRGFVFSVVEDLARDGNLVATIALARALGAEGHISKALELLRGIEVDAPPEPKGIDGMNITADHLDRMTRSLADTLSRGSESQSMLELLDAAFEDAGGDSMSDEIESVADDEECSAVPAKVSAAAQSLLEPAAGQDAVEVLDDLVALILESARTIPGSMFKDSQEIVGEVLAETAKQLAKLGQIDRALALATEVRSEEARGELLRDLVPIFIEKGMEDAANEVLSSLAPAAQDTIRVTIAKELAAKDARYAREILDSVHDLRTRADGLRALANILAQATLTANSYAELIYDVAVATARVGVMREIPEWCFYTVPLSLASAGRAQDIPRFLDLLPENGERSDELRTHGLGEGIDVLIASGHTGELEGLIDALDSADLRDGRRRRLALKLGETEGADAAQVVIASIEGGDTRSRAQRELVDVLLGRESAAEAIRVAAAIDGDARDDALKAIVRHSIDASDMKAALSAGDMVEHAWYKMWVRVMYVKGLINRGDVDTGLDMMKSILGATKEAGPDYEEFHADVIGYFCSECTEHVDLDLLAGLTRETVSPKWRARAAESIAAACRTRDAAELALSVVRDTHSYALGHEDAAAVEWALSSIIRTYVSCGDVVSARAVPEDARDERSKDRLLSDFNVAAAKRAAGLDDTGRLPIAAWSEMVRTIDDIQSQPRRIEACRRLLDLPGVRETLACRDHLVQIALRTYRGLDARVQEGIREGLVNTLVACGRPDAGAQLVTGERDSALGNLPFLLHTQNLAMNVGGSDCPEEWVRFLSLIVVPDDDAKQGLLQQTTYHLCQRSSGHLQATEEALEFIRTSGLSLPALATAYTHWHMAVSMLGSEILPCLLNSLGGSAMNPEVVRSAVYALLAVLIRSGHYGEAQKIAESCPALGLTGMFQEDN